MILSDHLSNVLLDQDYSTIRQYLNGWFLVPFLVSKEHSRAFVRHHCYLQFLAQLYPDCCSTLRYLGDLRHDLSHELSTPS